MGRESAVQTAKIIQLTEQMHMLTVAMFVLGLLQLFGALLQVALARAGCDRGARRPIAKGIYKDQYGLAATVKVRGQQREKRFPPDTSIKTIKKWQGDTKAALRKLRPKIGRGRSRATSSDISPADADADLRRMGETSRALVRKFGPRNRHTIQTLEIDTVLSRWLEAGLSRTRSSTVARPSRRSGRAWTGRRLRTRSARP